MENFSSQFSVADFIVFSGMLLLSLLIGVFYAFKDRKEKSIENYYFGGRQMSSIPVGLSVAVSFISSITVLAIPAHTYAYGTVIIWFGISLIPQLVFCNFYYIPMFRRLELSSVYEYLELRFNRNIRLITSVLVIILMILYMATTVYLTSLALTAVTPLSMATSIVVTAGICTVYTSLGGMKAVIWNDAFQSVIMFSGILAVTIASTSAVGGFINVWDAVERGGRDTFWTWDLDPTVTHSIWSIFVGSCISWGSTMCTNQAIVQRYQSCKTTRDARLASVIGVIPMVTFLVLSSLSGCSMYAYFEGCDPVQSGELDKIDQTVPYLVVNLFRSTPGMAGLFVAAAYSGMLSTVSSGINSLSALMLEDFIVPVKPKLGAQGRLLASKGLSVMFGILTTIMAFLTEYMGKTVIQVVTTLFGTFNGPILALFALGFHFPWTNNITQLNAIKETNEEQGISGITFSFFNKNMKIGAGCGLISGVVFAMWVALGAIFYGPKNSGILPFSTQNCSVAIESNSSEISTTILTSQSAAETTFVEIERPLIADTLYSVSYMYLAPLGLGMTLLTATIVTLLTGKNDPKNMDPKLFCPLLDNKFIPRKVRKFFRFGVAEMKEEAEEKEEVKDDLLKNRSDFIIKE